MPPNTKQGPSTVINMPEKTSLEGLNTPGGGETSQQQNAQMINNNNTNNSICTENGAPHSSGDNRRYKPRSKKGLNIQASVFTPSSSSSGAGAGAGVCVSPAAATAAINDDRALQKIKTKSRSGKHTDRSVDDVHIKAGITSCEEGSTAAAAATTTSSSALLIVPQSVVRRGGRGGKQGGTASSKDRREVKEENSRSGMRGKGDFSPTPSQSSEKKTTSTKPGAASNRKKHNGDDEESSSNNRNGKGNPHRVGRVVGGGDTASASVPDSAAASASSLALAAVVGPTVVCDICADEEVRYLAVGSCNHPICSKCAVRMRVKNKDKYCAICKGFMPVMLTCSVGGTSSSSSSTSSSGSHSTADGCVAAVVPLEKSFAELCVAYGLEDINTRSSSSSGSAKGRPVDHEENVDWSSLVPRPGVVIDALASVLFLDCAEHSREIEILRTISCPIAGCRFSNISNIDTAATGGVSANTNSNNSKNSNKRQNMVARFANNAALMKHMKDAHSAGSNSNSVTLCSLCVEHRPLFTSEHRLFTPNQLEQHMRGEQVTTGTGAKSRSKSGRNSTQQGVYDEGDDDQVRHRRCEFCRSSHFDAAALYHHMQLVHYTCHLCPQSMMFRYYEGMPSLHDHFRASHFVCRRCDENDRVRNSGESFAFSEYAEYTQHLEDYHFIRNSNNGASRREQQQAYMQQQIRVSINNTGERYFDLDMGTASPFYNENNSGSDAVNASSSSNGHSNSSTHRGQQSRINNNNRSMAARTAPGGSGSSTAAALVAAASRVPANMRIAGRITGSGRFAAMDESDRLQQEEAEKAHQALQAEQRKQQHSKQARSAKQMDELFPTLAASDAMLPRPPAALLAAAGAGGAGTTVVPPSTEPHPLSLMHARKQRLDAERAEREKAEAKRAELEKLRIQRSLQLAECFLGGGGGGGTDRRNGDGGGESAAAAAAVIRDGFTSYSSSASVSAASALLARLGLRDLASDADLIRTVYPPQLVSWARANRLDLLKIEKKVYDLLSSSESASIQLKPMLKPARTAMHSIARFYGLNSMEYDPEPRRYVSFVKTAHSCLPSTLLSSAAAQNPMNLVSQLESVEEGGYLGVTPTAVACLSKIPHIAPPEQTNSPVVYLYLHVPPTLSAAVSSAGATSVTATTLLYDDSGSSSGNNTISSSSSSIQTVHAYTSSSAAAAAATSGVYTVADVITRVRALLCRLLLPAGLSTATHNSYQQHAQLGLRGVRAVGASAVALEFSTVRLATRSFMALTRCIKPVQPIALSGSLSASTASAASAGSGLYPEAVFLSECFYLYPEFEPPSAEEYDDSFEDDERMMFESNTKSSSSSVMPTHMLAATGMADDCSASRPVTYHSMPTAAAAAAPAASAVHTSAEAVNTSAAPAQAAAAPVLFNADEAAALAQEWEELLLHDDDSGGHGDGDDDDVPAVVAVNFEGATTSVGGDKISTAAVADTTAATILCSPAAAPPAAAKYRAPTRREEKEDITYNSEQDGVQESGMEAAVSAAIVDPVPRYKAKRGAEPIPMSADAAGGSYSGPAVAAELASVEDCISAVATASATLCAVHSTVPVSATVQYNNIPATDEDGGASKAAGAITEATALKLNRKLARKQQRQEQHLNGDSGDGWQTTIGGAALSVLPSDLGRQGGGGGSGRAATSTAATASSSNPFAVLKSSSNNNNNNNRTNTGNARSPPIPPGYIPQSQPPVEPQTPPHSTAFDGMVAALCNLGFDESSAVRALRRCGNRVEEAANMLLGGGT